MRLFKTSALRNTTDVLDLETAVARVLAALPAPQTDRIPLAESAGRILAETIVSPLDLPAFDNSAMDGYAVRAAEVRRAKADTPIRLRLRTRIPAGETFSGELLPGECARLFTGAPLPCGADAVVMQEDTRIEGEEVLICDAVQPGENVRFQGEDIRQGTTLVEAGEELGPGKLCLLAATGVAAVGVGRQPKIGLVATGSELREAGQPLAPGQIYESNRAMLAPLVTQAGGVAKIYPLVSDTLEVTRAALETAFSECDLVITSGGVSVGEMDFVKPAFESLGGELQFWKVAIRPGKPFVFGRRGDKFLFGLPGNPVSAFVTFLLLVRPALRSWQGAREVSLPAQPGVLGEPITNVGDRRHFVRVRVDANGRVYSAGKQASHALVSLAKADGLLAVPPDTTWPVGTSVSVRRGF
jgi:molybdopterin molybdotransferase